MLKFSELIPTTYESVDQLIGFRHPRAVVSEALKAAIAWEDYLFKTEVIPDWQNECASLTLEYNQAYKQAEALLTNTLELPPLVLPPEPVIDMSKRRSYYQVEQLPFDTINLDAIGVDSIEYDDVNLRAIQTMATQSKPFDELERQRKLAGIEFEGVMCSATKEDMWGLSSVEGYVRTGSPTPFKFHNGNTLLLDHENIDAFYAKWVPFRASFFSLNKATQPSLML